MCYSGHCPHEDHMGNCTWDAPGDVWPEECSINQPEIITVEDEAVANMIAQLRAYQAAVIESFRIPSEFLRPSSSSGLHQKELP